jgi:oligopeptide/dipeptide ABC transporter ATP-binding protein
MYRGEIVEEDHVENLFNNPRHPYTKNLIAAIPWLN